MEKLTEMRARLLMCLVDLDESCRTNTYIANICGVAKSTISRAADWCEENNLLTRSDDKTMYLSNYGREVAERLAKSKKIVEIWCRSNNISNKNISNDSEQIYLHCSQEIIDVLEEKSVVLDAKRQVFKYKNPSSYQFCRALPDGEYDIEFGFYKHKKIENAELSMANEGFLHPARLKVQESEGKIVFHALNMQSRSKFSGIMMSGTVKNMRYKKDNMLYDAIKVGDEFVIPIDIFKFACASPTVMNATAILYIKSSVGNMHMPESKVDLILFI